jgi:hypothetical protein
MWPQLNFTICFRGLMVIHRVETMQPNFFEVGVVRDDHHFLRINTIKNGVLAEIKFLENEVRPEHKTWSLEVDNPIGSGVGAYTQGRFDRLKHTNEKDYRWITELGDLFGDIEAKVDTTRFFPVLRIRNGIFSTRAKSAELAKIVDGTAEPFGSIAAVVGCDIPMFAGRVRLVEQDTGRTIFTFEPDEKTIYEFANTPAEVPDHGGPHPDPVHDPAHDPIHDGDEHEDEDDPCQNEHFKRYYQLFRDPDAEASICFKKIGAAPAPDPATCGATGGSGIKSPFGGD